MSAFILALIGIIFPIVSLAAALWFLLTGEFWLFMFFVVWWVLWEEEE